MANPNKGCIISLPTETYAISAQRLLADKGISARVVKTDPAKIKKGCSVGVETDCRYIAGARSILIDHSIPVS